MDICLHDTQKQTGYLYLYFERTSQEARYTKLKSRKEKLRNFRCKINQADGVLDGGFRLSMKGTKVKYEKLSVSLFKVAPEHARGLGFSDEDCAKSVMAPGESGRHCDKINTTECTVCIPQSVCTIAVLIQLLVLTTHTKYYMSHLFCW